MSKYEENSEKDEQISHLKDEISHLESVLDTSNEQIDELSNTLDEKTNIINEYNDDIEYYESSINDVCDYYENDILSYFNYQIYYKVKSRLKSFYMSLVLGEEDSKSIDYFTSLSYKTYLKECLIDCYKDIIDELIPNIPQNVVLESCSKSNERYAYFDNSGLLEDTFFFDLTNFYINEIYRYVIIPLYGMLSKKEKELVKEDHHKSSMMKFLFHIQGHCFISLFDQLVSNYEVCDVIGKKSKFIYNNYLYYNNETLRTFYIANLSLILKYCSIHYEINSTYFELLNKYFYKVNESYLLQNVIEAIKDNLSKVNQINHIVTMIGIKNYLGFSVYNIKFENYYDSCRLNSHYINLYDDFDEKIMVELFNDYNIKDCFYYNNLKYITENSDKLFDIFSGKSKDVSMAFRKKGTKNENEILDISKENETTKNVLYHVNQYVQNYTSQSTIYYLWCCSIKATYLLTSNLQPCKIIWEQQFTNSNKYLLPYVMKTEYSNNWLSTKLLNIPQFLVVLKTIIKQQDNIENPFFNDNSCDLNKNYNDFNHDAYYGIINDIEDYINTIIMNCEKILKDNTYELDKSSINLNVELDHIKYAMYTLESILECFDDTKTDLINLNKKINKLKIKV
ncbi:hypothetical protein PBI_SCTP2_272 [Salicola phage SCTP-2]|nr:hypothetical protein PBI_SCTP2_272 [Salicola phage SCTP-2]